MKNERYQSKRPFRCSPQGKGAVRKVKPQDDQFTSTLFLVQKETKPVLGEGVLQDGGTASSEIPNTAGRLHDKIRSERCILCSSNSSLPQKVSEVCLSGQNQSYEFQCLPFGLSLAPRGIHKNTEASAGSVAVHGYPGGDLHRRHVITTPAEPDAAENLCSSGSLTGKTGLSGEEGEVLSRSWPKSNFS